MTPGRNLSRREFLKISAVLASCPALAAARFSKEIRLLVRADPGATPAQLNLVEFYSRATLLGPPATPKLLEFVAHLYTPEEAELVQHLSLVRGRTAKSVSRRAKRPEAEVEHILSRIADDKRAIIAWGEPEKPRSYGLLPFIPGTMELVMMEGKDDEWHRRFGSLFEEIYDAGYIARVFHKPIPAARYLPIEETIQASPAALPSDLLSEMIDANTSFGLGVCQCRQSRDFSGQDCGLPRDTCLATGTLADFLIERGIMRRVDRSEALEAKLKANAAGLATMSMNVEFDQPNISCSCCSCCCVILRTISQFNAPGLIAPPHFLPGRDENLCIRCGLCEQRCPMGAHALANDTWVFHRERCIGCGVCAAICPRQALRMQPVKKYTRPAPDYPRLALRMAPGYLSHLIKS